MSLSTVIMRNNVKNEIRNKAVEVLTNYVDNITNQDFGDITVGNFTDIDNVTIRSFSATYTISGNITSPSTNEKDINATISWTYRGKNYSYNIETVVTK